MTAEKPKEITVFISTRDSLCSECKEELGRKAWITLTEKKEALCLACADLAHLVFLGSGDAALTRRSKKYSKLYAVVIQWSKARKRYERQGLLVEREALNRAEEETLADADARLLRQQRDANRRAELDKVYIKAFTEKIREQFPKCPKNREKQIAEHACQKYSGRVGRTAAAKALDEQAILLAVIAHIRHTLTDYDEMLFKTGCRQEARHLVQEKVEQVLNKWLGNG